ncbi:hypothetical protein rosag_47050 [Roseisolibacter agri]|uniref:HEAT repeat protein n=2 Tax=Roseisolibacter agri TaxID=2014610 RepID=A0AA37QBC3_9BACT|nr:hypothetical protein rosag_47050 [Roseisolibacter agri]
MVGALGVVACAADPGYGGRSTKQWIAQLADPTTSARLEATTALGRVLAVYPQSAPAVAALVGALADTSDDVRVSAARELATEGVRAPDAVPGLARAMADSEHAWVREQVAGVLGTVLDQSLPPDARAATGWPTREDRPRVDAAVLAVGVDALIRGLGDPHGEVRTEAATALRRLGPRAARVAPQVIPAWRDLAGAAQPGLRVLAFDGLTAGGAPAALVLPLADAAIRRDTAAVVRTAAIHAVAPLGAAATAAVPTLRIALRDPDAGVRLAAAVALGKIGPGAAVSDLRAALTDADARVRVEAAHTLDAFHRRGGQDAPPAEPTPLQKCAGRLGTPGC